MENPGRSNFEFHCQILLTHRASSALYRLGIRDGYMFLKLPAEMPRTSEKQLTLIAEAACTGIDGKELKPSFYSIRRINYPSPTNLQPPN